MPQRRHPKGSPEGGRFQPTPPAEMPQRGTKLAPAGDRPRPTLRRRWVEPTGGRSPRVCPPPPHRRLLDDIAAAQKDNHREIERLEAEWVERRAPRTRKEGAQAASTIPQLGGAYGARIITLHLAEQMPGLGACLDTPVTAPLPSPAAEEAQTIIAEANTAGARVYADATGEMTAELLAHLEGVPKRWARKLAQQEKARQRGREREARQALQAERDLVRAQAAAARRA